MACFRLVYHGGVDSTPPKISGPIAPRKVKFYIHVAFDLYFHNMSREVQLYCLNGLNLALIFWPEFCLEKAPLEDNISGTHWPIFLFFIYLESTLQDENF